MKFKLTDEEKKWILYDVGNSAFVLLVATIIPIYFNFLAGNAGLSSVEYLAYWGYIGSCIPFVACLGLVLGADAIGISMSTAMLLSFLIVAVWWIGCTVPLLRVYKQKHFVDVTNRESDITRLVNTIKEVVKNKKVFLFIVAFFFYIDGVYTIIDMATAYGKALGFGTAGLLLALLATQIVAFPSSIIIGRLSRKKDSADLLTVCIMAYFGISVFAVFMTSQIHFWILAIAVGLFQGGVQALSRSYFAKIIPPEKSGEYFGLLDICGKGASIIGTLTVSAVSQITGSANLGVGSLSIFFIVGLILFRKSADKSGVKEASKVNSECKTICS